MTNKLLRQLWIPILTLLVPVGANADGMDPLERDVLSRMHSTNQMEIQMGKLAQKRGSTPEVRRYGDRLVRDHELADRMILRLARIQGHTIAPPQARDPEETVKMEEKAVHMATLEQLEGEAFDQMFLKMMRDGHVESISMLFEARRSLMEPSALRRVIAKVLPILRQHEQLAQIMGRHDGHTS